MRALVDSLEDALLDGLAKSQKSNDDLSDAANDYSNSAANCFSKPPRLSCPSFGRNSFGCTNFLLPPFADLQNGSRERGTVAPNSKPDRRSSLESVDATSSMLLKSPLGSKGTNCLSGV